MTGQLASLGRTACGLFLGLALIASAATARADLLYSVIDLGTLGGNQSFALDVNNNRQVTGNAQTTTGTLPLFAFRWQDGLMTSLGVLPGSNNFSRGYGINEAGVIVGESDNNTPRAFRWQNGTLTDLGTLGGASAVAHDINNAGRIVGASSNGMASRPFLFQNGQMFDLGTLAGGADTPGRGWAINQQGDVAGLSRTFGFTSQATLWQGDPAAGPVRLTNLGSLGDGQQFSQAFGLNDALQVVGESVVGQTPGGSDLSHAFLWQNGTLTDLGTLSGFPTLIHSRANDLNNAGQAVGHVSDLYNFPSLNGRAVLWENGAAIDLNSLIAADSGWVLRSAEAINDQGDIVSFGTVNGQTRAFLLTSVPEPTTLTLTIIGSAGVAGAVWRRWAGRSTGSLPFLSKETQR